MQFLQNRPQFNPTFLILQKPPISCLENKFLLKFFLSEFSASLQDMVDAKTGPLHIMSSPVHSIFSVFSPALLLAFFLHQDVGLAERVLQASHIGFVAHIILLLCACGDRFEFALHTGRLGQRIADSLALIFLV